jgi:hypothetical protein
MPVDISSSNERKDCFARPVLNLDRVLARSGSRNSKPQQRPPMSFRDYVKVSGTSPNPRVRASNTSSPIDSLSRPAPTQEASIRPNRFLSREQEPRTMSHDQRIRINSGPRISLYTQRRPDFQFSTEQQSLQQLGLPLESTLAAGIKSAISFETYLRFLAKQDGPFTILTDIFHGISKVEFTEMLRPMKSDESHTFIVFQRVPGG